MIIENNFEVKADQKEVWDFLMDTEALANCLPGCEEVEQKSDQVYGAIVAVQIAFIKLKFNVNVEITDIEPPEQLVSEVNGKPLSMVGQLKMKAKLNLTSIDEGVTQVYYHMDMNMTGKLGSLGQSAFRSKATEMGDDFAQNIKNSLEGVEAQN